MFPERLLRFITVLNRLRQKAQVLRLRADFHVNVNIWGAHVYCRLIMRDKPAAFLNNQVSLQINSFKSNGTWRWIIFNPLSTTQVFLLIVPDWISSQDFVGGYRTWLIHISLICCTCVMCFGQLLILCYQCMTENSCKGFTISIWNTMLMEKSCLSSNTSSKYHTAAAADLGSKSTLVQAIKGTHTQLIFLSYRSRSPWN